MANINNPDQINFCDNIIRPGANMLCQAYYSAKARAQMWNANGAGDSALALMGDLIRATSDFLALHGGVYEFSALGEQTWNLKGNIAFIPNDASVLILDGPGGNTQRQPQPINGANVNIVAAQLISFRQWLQNNSFTTGGTGGNFANLQSILQTSRYGVPVPLLSDAQNFITRCNGLVAQYEANSNNILNNLLVCASNPDVIR